MNNTTLTSSLAETAKTKKVSLKELQLNFTLKVRDPYSAQ